MVSSAKNLAQMMPLHLEAQQHPLSAESKSGMRNGMSIVFVMSIPYQLITPIPLLKISVLALRDAATDCGLIVHTANAHKITSRPWNQR